MIDWFGVGKAAASEAKDVYERRKQRKLELRWDLILEAIGPEPSCLDPGEHPYQSVSFDTIERRVRLLQVREPERARKSGIPAVDDSKRERRIRHILQEMVIAGWLRRCRIVDRWQLPQV
jgi:hypothetical protein